MSCNIPDEFELKLGDGTIISEERKLRRKNKFSNSWDHGLTRATYEALKVKKNTCMDKRWIKTGFTLS